jgi:predicted transcriptional regulator
VVEITKSYRWAPFLPIEPDESMLTVLLLLSKFRLRSIPVVNDRDPDVKNVITQSAVIQGLSQCRGRDWFDSLAGKSLFQIGLPVMSPDQVKHVQESHQQFVQFLVVILIDR